MLLGLQAAKDGLCSHKAARHIALHLLAPGTKRYLPAHAAAMLSPASIAAPLPEKTSAAPAADEAPALFSEVLASLQRWMKMRTRRWYTPVVRHHA